MLWSDLSLSQCFMPHIGCCGLPGRQLNMTAIHSFPLQWGLGEKQKKNQNSRAEKMMVWRKMKEQWWQWKKNTQSAAQCSPSVPTDQCPAEEWLQLPPFYGSSQCHPVRNNPPAAWISCPGSVPSQLLLHPQLICWQSSRRSQKLLESV